MVVENSQGNKDVHILGDGDDLSDPPKKRTISWVSEDGDQVLKMDIQDVQGSAPPEEWRWKLTNPNTHEVKWMCKDFTATMTFTKQM
mmetsp:Transcript_74406/g.131563  ORF Transcript_74406/g.131563 Transcript_74406/m.131563 type:complete len:87 (-) Transcript_74406:40-300(-)